LTAWHAKLPASGDPGRANGEHEKLIQRLCHPAQVCSPDQRKLSLWFSGQLDSMRALRIVADYKLADSVTFDQAMHACAISGQMLGKT
jgi:hypothetical protein